MSTSRQDRRPEASEEDFERPPERNIAHSPDLQPTSMHPAGLAMSLLVDIDTRSQTVQLAGRYTCTT